MEKIGNNDKKIETKKQAPSIRVNKLYSICSAAYMFAAVVIMFGAGIGGIEFPSWVKQAALMVFMILALWIPMAIKTENHKLRTALVFDYGLFVNAVNRGRHLSASFFIAD